MDITWFGHSCFRLVERGKATVITDPYNGEIGYKLPKKLRADVVTVSHNAPGHANLAVWPEETRLITRPGEYEIGGVFVIGIATHNPENPTQQNIVYVLDFEGLTVAHLGDLSYIPGQSDIEALGAINVALVPVGGGNALNASLAAEVISLIEPDIVIPMHYQTDYTKLKLDPLDRFLTVMGISKVQTESALKITASGLPEQTQIIVLDPQQ